MTIILIMEKALENLIHERSSCFGRDSTVDNHKIHKRSHLKHVRPETQYSTCQSIKSVLVEWVQSVSTLDKDDQESGKAVADICREHGMSSVSILL